jgi:hypothetical protein
VFVVHDDVIVAQRNTSSCYDCVNITHDVSIIHDANDSRVNDTQRQSLNVSIIHDFNDPPLRVCEGGIDAEFFSRGAKREEDGKVSPTHSTYEEAHAA